ncbi:hypothetical protein OEW28_09370 [Defluviimonas sp. WL0002]|uniref:Uncharacterized protein n=1 Tax=Albidovulum marisflavi TaxID=2984159 RepID=A0ABT2ZCL7_9RHOB|nr:primase-helicase family protein [Defluviimonas sp. WL0002]MCV2868836.1 hypothetical protein [Defluviimonas sp. WL0002]
MGTGKSALGRLLIRLFGAANAITQNYVDKLTGRFSMTVPCCKLVICEEVNLRIGGGDLSQLWLQDILDNHLEEARSRAFFPAGQGRRTENGCLETPTASARKVRCRGRQLPA